MGTVLPFSPTHRASFIGRSIRLVDGRVGTIRTCTWGFEGFVEFAQPDGGSAWANLRTEVAEWLEPSTPNSDRVLPIVADAVSK